MVREGAESGRGTGCTGRHREAQGCTAVRQVDIICVCVCVCGVNSIHCTAVAAAAAEMGKGKGRAEGRGCLMWVGNAFHLIAQLLHVLRVPQPTVHTVHAPKTTQVTTLAYFSAQAATHANHHARACTYSPATPPPYLPIPSTHSVMQNVAYQLTLAKQEGGRERGSVYKISEFCM